MKKKLTKNQLKIMSEHVKDLHNLEIAMHVRYGNFTKAYNVVLKKSLALSKLLVS